MRPTGIVRRVDDLGRVIIPKEIRRTLGIKEGELLEIYTDENTVCFKKYQQKDFYEWFENTINEEESLTTEEKNALNAMLKVIKSNKTE